MATNPKNKIASSHPELAALKNEDLISIDLTPVDLIAGQAQIDDCCKFLQINKQTFGKDKRLIDRIRNEKSFKYKIFFDFFDKATSLTVKQSEKDPPILGYVTGLRMNYGIEGSDLRILYQPVKLTRTTDSTSENSYSVTVDDTTFYKYDNKSDAFIKGSDTSFLDNYKDPNGIQILRNENDTKYDSYKEGTDVKSVIFSFQEIFALLYYNNGNTVSVYSAILKSQETTGIIIKHSLLLAPEGIEPDPLEEFFAKNILHGVYADLAHLCPPNCKDVIYDLE